MPASLDASTISVYGEDSVFKSNFNLSVMSYYPLIDFFCQILKELINYIKIKRIEENSKNPGSHEKLDIKSVVEQMEGASSLFKPLYSKSVEIGTKLEFKLGEATFHLELDKNSIR